jgi:hypothetical protein
VVGQRIRWGATVGDGWSYEVSEASVRNRRGSKDGPPPPEREAGKGSGTGAASGCHVWADSRPLSSESVICTRFTKIINAGGTRWPI